MIIDEIPVMSLFYHKLFQRRALTRKLIISLKRPNKTFNSISVNTDVFFAALNRYLLDQKIYILLTTMTKNILMPGGIGYIGSHVAIELLLHTNHRMTIIDNCLNSTVQNIDRIFECVSFDLPKGEDIEPYKARISFYQGDILDLNFLNSVFQKEVQLQRPITTIFHFAAKKSAPESVMQPLDYYENNFVGSMNLLKIMEIYTDCREFLFSSSAAVYGEQDDCTQKFQCRPISPYGESKLCVEMLLKAMAVKNKHWKIISVRYFNPAGNHHSGLIGDNPMGSIPGNLFSVIQEVIIGKRDIITVFGADYNTFDGSGVRDFVHVVDLAKGHLKAMQYMDKMSGNYEVFNFGSGNGYSVLQVIKQFQQILHHKLNYKMGDRRPGDLQRLVTASEKAQKLLGWKTEKSLKDMCQSCVKFTVLLLQLKRKQNMK